MVNKRKAKFNFFSCSIIIIICMAVFVIFWLRNDGQKVKVENELFTESSRELKNPNRGFYNLYRFLITDEKQDYPEMISTMFREDSDTKLALIQICLKTYRNRSITEEGLDNIESLFDALESLDKHLIVRFAYDSEGENERYEPESLDIILAHMDQLSYILRKYSDRIFSLQGLFIGNWGEMNGTKYNSDEELKRLANKLASVTEQSTYLAVRLPAQWRSIMQTESACPKNPLAARMGLFNDGMLGNESDYGTYKTEEYVEKGVLFPRLKRAEELSFQNELCSKVPNGGEVIHDNIYNDLERAIKDLELMHVTYLNQGYDQEVLGKWADTEIKEKGCFEGMDGLTYMERHLGYRLTIVDTRIHRQRKEKELTAEVTLRNVGFAPLYKETEARMILYNEKEEEALFYPISQDLRVLAGGNEKEEELTLSVKIPIRELAEEEYTVYFSIVDSDTEELILLANEEDAEWYGYRIGKVSFTYY